jgi:hypothetical protein
MFIALTQVPYTGFDFGPIGNTLYWLGLVAWAGFAGYLLIAKQSMLLGMVGSIGGLARPFLGGNMSAMKMGADESEEPDPNKEDEEDGTLASAHSHTGTGISEENDGRGSDRMEIQESIGVEMPRIVIQRPQGG